MASKWCLRGFATLHSFHGPQRTSGLKRPVPATFRRGKVPLSVLGFLEALFRDIFSRILGPVIHDRCPQVFFSPSLEPARVAGCDCCSAWYDQRLGGRCFGVNVFLLLFFFFCLRACWIPHCTNHCFPSKVLGLAANISRSCSTGISGIVGCSLERLDLSGQNIVLFVGGFVS